MYEDKKNIDANSGPIATNRLMWDDRVEAHWKSAMYRADADALRGGGHCLYPHVVEAVGGVAGKSLLQLQCHMGMETLSWAQLGADVVGLDFSQPAIDKAKLLRDELALNAEFICANFYDAPKVINKQFDIVFQSIGCLCWLPDLEGWAKVIAAMLNEGGRYILNECHPFSDVLEQRTGAEGTSHLQAVNPYLGNEPIEFNDGGTYADPHATFTHNRSIEHIHPLGDIITNLIEAGLTLDRVSESDFCPFPRYAMMQQTRPFQWELPGTLHGKLPMTFTLTAHK